jgi:phage-related protein
LRFLLLLLEVVSLMVVGLGWVLSVWATHLSTAATIGETVIAAVRAVAASIRSLAGRFRFSTTRSVAICSIVLTLIV